MKDEERGVKEGEGRKVKNIHEGMATHAKNWREKRFKKRGTERGRGGAKGSKKERWAKKH
jgi:hypothetical protein